MRIKKIIPNKTLASLGNETIKAKMMLENGISSETIVPSGISKGKYEIKNVTADEAIVQINRIKDILMSGDWRQETLDKRLNELGLGGNTSLVISASFWKANEKINVPTSSLKFPSLMLLLFEGGEHGNPNIFIQEFMIIERCLSDAISDFKRLRSYLVNNNLESTVGVEGGFSPSGFNDLMTLDTIKKIFPQKEIALDIAANFRKERVINFELLISKYNIRSLEDPFTDEDWEQWVSFCSRFGKRLMIVGDDLTTTNPERLGRATDLEAINAVIVKPNQIGTISGALEAVKIARSKGLKVIVSHRGEDNIDDWIVDFALRVEADFVKFGGIERGERIAKYNRLLELGMK
ncbi:MAG: hypothetical protein HYT07_01540 [Candidatus Levybacteria bacterium]|nr:hypothetical protein [Candidatus Levybacteria bacterium]